MSNPMVSVIVPVYNAEHFIKKCVDAISTQTFTNLDVILIDDGSTDSTGSILNSYKQADKRVRTMHKNNGGSSSAKNLGLSLAKGDFVTFIDADDYVDKDFVLNLLNCMKKTDTLIATTPATSKEPDTLCDDGTEVCERFHALERMFYGTLEKSENGIQMFSRKLLIENHIQFDDKIKIGEDFDFFVKALSHCNEVAIDYRRMYYYRKNPDSQMNQPINTNLMSAVSNFATIGEGLMLEYPELKPAVNAKVFSDSISLSLRSHTERHKWVKERRGLKNDVKALRWRILLDRKARTKVRIAAFIYCIFGYELGTKILKEIKK